MEEEDKPLFTFGNSYKKVQLSYQGYRKCKDFLGFEHESEYYLKIPNKNYLPMVLLCLFGTTKLTNKLDKILDTFTKGEKEALK